MRRSLSIFVETGGRIAGRAALSKLGPYPQPVVAGGVVAIGGQRDGHCYGRVFRQMAGRVARCGFIVGFQIGDQPDCD